MLGPPSEPSEAGRMGRGRAAERVSFVRKDKTNDTQLARTKEQGVSRMLTINLNDVEKELKLK